MESIPSQHKTIAKYIFQMINSKTDSINSMQHSPLIRQYSSNDYDSVLELIRLNTPTYFSRDEEKDLADYLKFKIQDYFVIELSNQIVGSGGINYSDDKVKGIISWDMIHPKFQGKGFGKMLLEHRISILNDINRTEVINSIEKIIVRTSQLTYPFYEKSGFEIIKIVKDYWAKGFDLEEVQLLK